MWQRHSTHSPNAILAPLDVPVISRLHASGNTADLQPVHLNSPWLQPRAHAFLARFVKRRHYLPTEHIGTLAIRWLQASLDPIRNGVRRHGKSALEVLGRKDPVLLLSQAFIRTAHGAAPIMHSPSSWTTSVGLIKSSRRNYSFSSLLKYNPTQFSMAKAIGPKTMARYTIGNALVWLYFSGLYKAI